MARSSTKTTTKAAFAKRGRGAKAAKPAAPPASADGASHVGSRVAKVFSGEIFHGTVAKFYPRKGWWSIEYDDGDKEDMDWNDLSKAMELFDDQNNGKNGKGKRGRPKKSAAKKVEAETSEATGVVPEQDVEMEVDNGNDANTAIDDSDEGKPNGKEEKKVGRSKKVGRPKKATPSPEQDAEMMDENNINTYTDAPEDAMVGGSVEDDKPEVASVPAQEPPDEPSKEWVEAVAAVVEPSVTRQQQQQRDRNFGQVDREIIVDAHLFQRNPCRVHGGTTRDPAAYPNHRLGKGSFGFLIQRLSDRNYAMRAHCLEGVGAEYTTYQKNEDVSYISVVWFPPSNLNEHGKDGSIVDGCHLDLIDPTDGRTYLTGAGLEESVVNAKKPVECVFLNGAQSNGGSVLAPEDIANALSKCKDTLLCVSLTECKLSASILEALATCTKLRGLILENCQLVGEGEDRPVDGDLSAVLASCADLRWVFVKASIFSDACWSVLASSDCCPHLEVLWVDSALQTMERVDVARGDHDTIRAVLKARTGTLKLCMINPDEKHKSRYILGAKGDRLDGRRRTQEEVEKMTDVRRRKSYLSTV